MDLLLFLLVGLVAGWLAGQIMKGKGFGLVGNLVIGVIGAFIGRYVFRLLGLAAGSSSKKGSHLQILDLN